MQPRESQQQREVGLSLPPSVFLSPLFVAVARQKFSGIEVEGLNLQAEIPDLDSTTAADAVSAGVLNNVMEGLYRLDQDEQPQPAMAKSVEISDDKLTCIFTLRDGVRWSNGDPVTAQNFEYAWLRAMDPETAGQISSLVSGYIRGAPCSARARARPRTWQ